MDENQLIGDIRGVIPTGEYTLIGSGDDCAQVAARTKNFLITTDMLVQGRHFRRDWSTAREIGYRAIMQNLADIAAMGAVPTSVVVALGLPVGVSSQWVMDLSAGMADALEETEAGLVGGDISGADEVVISVTATGQAEKVVTRGGAKPGDVIAIAGTLGLSYLGLNALLQGAVSGETPTEGVPAPLREAIRCYRTPHPPIALGPVAAQFGATAMMDVSDGLSTDLLRLAKASSVDAHLDLSLLSRFVAPLEPAAALLDIDPLEACLNGGEDHALLATFPGETVLPEGFSPVGKIASLTSETSPQVTLQGRPVPPSGWDHLVK